MALRLLYVVLVILFSSTALAQQIYKWKDWKDGKEQWHFSNFPPPGTVVEKVGGTEIIPKSSQAPSVKGEVKEKSEAPGGGDKALTTAKQLAEEKARRQKKYKKRLDEITRQIMALNKRHDIAYKELSEARGGYITKIVPGETINVSAGRVIHPSPRSSIIQRSPHMAIIKERELSEMTKQLMRLNEKREKLIREIKQKGFETGYIPY